MERTRRSTTNRTSRIVTDLPDEVVFGVLMLLGVITPMMLNNYLDNQIEG